MLESFMRAIIAPNVPALFNHLWQSTLCLVIAGLLTLVLRKNHARARYGLWLAASVKFLIPFSLLVTLGAHMARPRVLKPPEPGLFLTVEEVSQPFTKEPHAQERRLPPELAADWRYRLIPALPAVFMTVWLGGTLLVLAGWWRRWRRIAEALQAAEPLSHGREVEALRRAERLAGVQKRIDMLLSQTSLEPGIFGIVDPVLVWPAGISEHLQDAHLEAILAHEVWHVRRHDNLAAAIHMVVEAIFWFHPLVWWLGARLVEERERACDEAVLQLGGEPRVYAESILKTCQFCLESPLACVSGITGAELKKRIVRIMTQHSANNLSFGRKLLLVGIAIAAVAGPVVFGLVNAPQIRAQSAPTTNAPLPTFEVASVKPSNPHGRGPIGLFTYPGGKVTAGLCTFRYLMMFAFDVQSFQVSGGPGWINDDRYDIIAVPPASSRSSKLNPPYPKVPPNAEQRQMLQMLLMDRFQLKFHRESKEGPVYALVKGNRELKLQDAKNKADYPWAGGLEGGVINGDGLAGKNISMPQLAARLSRYLDRPVVDQTGLKGSYDFKYEYSTDESTFDVVSCIFASVQGIGLKLKPAKGPVETIVIDHIERPSEN